jgi:hypothetical protein
MPARDPERSSVRHPAATHEETRVRGEHLFARKVKPSLGPWALPPYVPSVCSPLKPDDLAHTRSQSGQALPGGRGFFDLVREIQGR